MATDLLRALQAVGMPAAEAGALAERVRACAAGESAPRRWRQMVLDVLSPALPFPVQRAVFEHVYGDWPSAAGPAPAWVPAEDACLRANLGVLMRHLGMPSYAALQRWSVTHRDAFWELAIQHLGIRFAQPPTAVRGGDDPRAPQWLPGARLNIAASCFLADPARPAVLFQAPGGSAEVTTYGELDALSNRVANGLVALGFKPGDAAAIAMPMTTAAIAVYLGVVKAGCVAVAIADQFSEEEIARRLRLGRVRGVVVQQVSGHGAESVRDKLVAVSAPPMVVMPEHPGGRADLRPGDVAWSGFLSGSAHFVPVPMPPDAAINVLFSSGTTREPKAIPWTHTTPIRCAVDAWLHHDVHPDDILAWPTSLAWMMGPWLIYAALVNQACLAIYGGHPISRSFGQFVQDAGVTMLGVVPTLVRSWRHSGCMEGLDWRRVRRFSSTGECSNAEDMLYLMWLAGWKPVIEYCGGTEIGGGYITGTLVQPAAPGFFTTPALGLDFVLLDELGKPVDNGELFLIPPSIGLSNSLLNHDHDQVYYEGTPTGPQGELLRRHGDQMERLPGGWYRSHGRSDDTMNLKGIKVSSAEIERAIGGVRGIRETAAVAVPPAAGGPDELVIYVVLQPGVVADPKHLRRELGVALRTHHSSLFKIHDVVLVDALPRTPSNKVMRRLLRARYRPASRPP